MVDNILNNVFFKYIFQRYAVDLKTVPDALMGQVALLPELILFCECHVKNQRIICACLVGYVGFFRRVVKYKEI